MGQRSFLGRNFELVRKKVRNVRNFEMNKLFRKDFNVSDNLQRNRIASHHTIIILN